MQSSMLPARIWPWVLDQQTLARMQPVTSLDIFDGASSEFHDEGLYSTRIFGRVGSDTRDRTIAYIDLKVDVLHPKIYRDLISLKGLYNGILSGRETAVFDPATKDFIADRGPTARTGYSFFMEHWKELQPRQSKSITRMKKVELINRYRDISLISKLSVIPAGLRDIEVAEGGRVTKNEVHDLYFRALSIANTIPVTQDMTAPALDISRYSLTLTLLEIYELFESMLEGKKGFILDKWASRRVTWGTRNVLTVMDTSSADLEDDNVPGFDCTTLGLYQTIRGLTPVTIYLLRQLLPALTDPSEGQVPLINPKTWASEWVTLSPKTRDIWGTKDGLSTVIDRYQNIEARHRPVEVEGYYVALVYIGPDDTFRVFHDINELPADRSRKDVHPMSLVEMLYLCGYNRWNNYYAQICRYPITGVESIYPSRVYVKTTTVGERRRALGPDWQPIEGDEGVALEFPKHTLNAFMDTQSPHSTKLDGLTADFDGDTGSGTYVMTEQALAENRRILASRNAWVKADGSLTSSCAYDTLEMVMRNLTGRFYHVLNTPVSPVL